MCFHCSLLLVDNRNVRFKAACRKCKGKRRLKQVSDLCRAKLECEFGEEDEVEKAEEAAAVSAGAMEVESEQW